MADDLWVYDFETGEAEKIIENPHQDIIPMWVEDEIFFLSDRDRTMNLFVYNNNTKETTKVTHFDNYDIKFPSHSDGQIVFENGGYIYKFDTKTKTQEKVNILLADDFAYGRAEIKDASKNINAGDLAPNGERVVFSARGDIFTLPAKHGITRNLTKTSGVHERGAYWSPDGKHIAYISDQTGEFEIWMQNQDGSGKPVQLTKGSKTFIFDILWSPDSKKILFNTKEQKLLYVDVETGKTVLVDKSDEAPWFRYNWSPDSKWIGYTKSEKGMTKLRLFNTGTGKTHVITDGWYNSNNPVFSSDGKYLVFTSARTFSPTYSRTEWNHAYVDMTKVYLITLAKSTPSPFAPENDVVKPEEDEKDKKDENGDKKDKEAENKKVMIDIDGIKERIVALPVKASNYFNLYGGKDKIYYIERSSKGGGMTAKVYDLKEKEEKELGKNIRFTVSSNGKKMLVTQNKKYAVIPLPSGKVTLKDTIDLSNMKVFVNLKEEWNQIFDESWRHMRDFFYAPNMHGVDWKAMHDKYAGMLPWVNHRNDLTYILGEMVGELSVGHAYVNNGERPKPDRIKTGLLGAKLSKHESGYYRIEHILDGANWSSSLRSPFKEIGVNMEKGDYILAIDGKPTGEMVNVYRELVGKAGNQVILEVNNKPEKEGSREVLIKPIGDESNLYYYNWVQSNIRKVSKATNEKVGYLHIPDMGVTGLNEFVKYYYPQLQKEALIIDVRGNGGGNVSPMLIERLMRDITYATMHTGQKTGNINPVGQLLGPKVCLLDKYSASDGDLFPYRFKYNQLGKLIGTRSWGGVVGYSGTIRCIDGGSLVTPSYGPYAADGSGWIIEGIGVEPDIVIENDPADEYKGIDAQLSKAIEVILKELEEYNPEVPPIPPFPDKSGGGK
jgi:tricorn protease